MRLSLSALALLTAALLCCLSTRPALAAAFVQTEVVSGVVVQVNPDQSVRLDNGNTYQPGHAGLHGKLAMNQMVTLRYTKSADGELQFFEYAPGRNSLKENTPPKAKPNLPK